LLPCIMAAAIPNPASNLHLLYRLRPQRRLPRRHQTQLLLQVPTRHQPLRPLQLPRLPQRQPLLPLQRRLPRLRRPQLLLRAPTRLQLRHLTQPPLVTETGTVMAMGTATETAMEMADRVTDREILRGSSSSMHRKRHRSHGGVKGTKGLPARIMLPLNGPHH
jgi:hypothetical protein